MLQETGTGSVCGAFERVLRLAAAGNQVVAGRVARRAEVRVVAHGIAVLDGHRHAGHDRQHVGQEDALLLIEDLLAGGLLARRRGRATTLRA